MLVLSVSEHGVPSVFRLHGRDAALPAPESVTVETARHDGASQVFAMADWDSYLEAVVDIPEPRDFTATVNVAGVGHSVAFEEHGHAHGAAHRDNNMRAAVIHVLADAAAAVLVIVGLLLVRTFGWLWMDPLAGIVGACIIASWAYGLVRPPARSCST